MDQVGYLDIPREWRMWRICILCVQVIQYPMTGIIYICKTLLEGLRSRKALYKYKLLLLLLPLPYPWCNGFGTTQIIIPDFFFFFFFWGGGGGGVRSLMLRFHKDIDFTLYIFSCFYSALHYILYSSQSGLPILLIRFQERKGPGTNLYLFMPPWRYIEQTHRVLRPSASLDTSGSGFVWRQDSKAVSASPPKQFKAYHAHCPIIKFGNASKVQQKRCRNWTISHHLHPVLIEDVTNSLSYPMRNTW